MQRLVWSINKILYRVLGPNASTQLSQSWFGKLALRILGTKPMGMKIYKGLDNIRLRLTPQEASYFGFLHFGQMNVHETNLMKGLLKKGDTVVDIGGYVDGWHSIVSGRIVGERGHVYVFEPIPVFYKRLKENISLNNLSNVTIEQMAVSAINGHRYFYNNNASSSFFATHARHGHHSLTLTRFRVKVVTLDSYRKERNIERLCLVKIDAEGAEMDVLRGATNTLKGPSAPDLIIEIDDRYLHDGGTSESEILQYLKKFGYTPYSILPGGVGRYKRKSEGRELFNVFFSKKHLL